MSDDLTRFRTAHPSMLDAIAACDRPDWLVQLAWEVVFALVMRRSLAAIVRRRAVQRDDRAALGIVLDEVRKGTAANPQLVPIVPRSTGGRLRRFLNAGESQ